MDVLRIGHSSSELLHVPGGFPKTMEERPSIVKAGATNNNWSMEEYRRIGDLIAARTGLVFDDRRSQDVRRVVNDIRASLNLPSVDSLTLYLSERSLESAMWRKLVEAVTIGETYFFRNKAHFDVLRNEILPQLIAERREIGLKQLRFWSAGCATGEEPYSIAMLLRDLLPDYKDWTIYILATDLNKDHLSRAERGLFRPGAFRNETPEYVKARWFTANQDGYLLDRSIRDMVIFRELNLVSDDYPSFETLTTHLDLIICRNVTIYFERETTRDVVTRFYKSLNNAGWLIVGHSEPQGEIYEPFEFRNFKHATVYQKSDARPAALNSQSQSVTPLLARATATPKPPRSNVGSPKSTPPKTIDVNTRPHQHDREVPEGDLSDWERAKLAANYEHWDEALEWLGRTEVHNLFQPEVHYLRALVHLHTDAEDAALWSLRQAVYCDPNFALAHYTLGDVHHRRGAQQVAVRHWRLAQAIIAPLEPQDVLPYGEDLTVEMLQALLTHRLAALSWEANHVDL